MYLLTITIIYSCHKRLITKTNKCIKLAQVNPFSPTLSTRRNLILSSFSTLTPSGLMSILKIQNQSKIHPIKCRRTPIVQLYKSLPKTNPFTRAVANSFSTCMIQGLPIMSLRLHKFTQKKRLTASCKVTKNYNSQYSKADSVDPRRTLLTKIIAIKNKSLNNKMIWS